MTTAYALTATGDREAGKAWVAAVSDTLDEAMKPAEPDTSLAPAPSTENEAEAELSKEEERALRIQKADARDKVTLARLERLLAAEAMARGYDPLVVLIDARQAINEGRLADAAGIGEAICFHLYRHYARVSRGI